MADARGRKSRSPAPAHKELRFRRRVARKTGGQRYGQTGRQGRGQRWTRTTVCRTRYRIGAAAGLGSCVMWLEVLVRNEDWGRSAC